MTTFKKPLEELAAAWDEGAASVSAERDAAYGAIESAITRLTRGGEVGNVVAALQKFMDGATK